MNRKDDDYNPLPLKVVALIFAATAVLFVILGAALVFFVSRN